MTSVIRDAILIAIKKNGGTFEGTEELSRVLNTINNKKWVVRCVRILERDGEIYIARTRGGRGHRTVYKSTTARKLINERH